MYCDFLSNEHGHELLEHTEVDLVVQGRTWWSGQALIYSLLFAMTFCFYCKVSIFLQISNLIRSKSFYRFCSCFQRWIVWQVFMINIRVRVVCQALSKMNQNEPTENLAVILEKHYFCMLRKINHPAHNERSLKNFSYHWYYRIEDRLHLGNQN